MNMLKAGFIAIIGQMTVIQLALAGDRPDPTPPPTQAVPEIDGSGAILAIGLVVVLVAFVREKFFTK